MNNSLILEILNYITLGLLISLPILFLFGIYKLLKKDQKSVKRIVIAFTVIFLLISLIFTIVLKIPTDTFFLLPDEMTGINLFLGLIFPLIFLYFILSVMYLIYKGFIKKEKVGKNVWIFTVILFILIMYTTYLYYIDPPTYPQWHDYDMVIF
jgi:uncharacterized BrkB/YihY/UPF0761 family membrane protein